MLPHFTAQTRARASRHRTRSSVSRSSALGLTGLVLLVVWFGFWAWRWHSSPEVVRQLADQARVETPALPSHLATERRANSDKDRD
jgi:hypothetical protein